MWSIPLFKIPAIDKIKNNVIVGDVNEDGKVNTLDRVILTRYIAKWEEYPAGSINTVAADVNCDGKVNIYDVTAARKGIINGITTPLAEANADVDGNGAFEAADLVQIHNYVMGRITEFKPYETESE